MNRSKIATDIPSFPCPPPAFVSAQIQLIQRHLHSDFNESKAVSAVFQLFSFFRYRHRGLETLPVWKTYVLDILEQTGGDHMFQEVVTLLEMKGLTHGVPLQCLIFGLPLQEAKQLPHLWVRTEDHFASRLSLYFPSSNSSALDGDVQTMDKNILSPAANFGHKTALEGLSQKLWQRYVVHELSSPVVACPYPFRAFVFGQEGTGKHFAGLQFQCKLSQNKGPGTWLFHDATLSRFDFGKDLHLRNVGNERGTDDLDMRVNRGEEKEVMEEERRMFYHRKVESIYHRLETALERLPQLEEACLVLSIDADVLSIPRLAALFPVSTKVHLIVTADEEDVPSSEKQALNRLAAGILGDRLGVVYRTTQEDLTQSFVGALVERCILENVTSVVTRQVAADVAREVARWVLNSRSDGGGAKERDSNTWKRIRTMIRPVCSRVIANFSDFLDRVLADITAQMTLSQEEQKDTHAAVNRIQVTTLALRETLALDLGLDLLTVPDRRDVLVALLDDFVQQFQVYIDIKRLDRQVQIESVLKGEKVVQCLSEAICSMLDGVLRSDATSE